MKTFKIKCLIIILLISYLSLFGEAQKIENSLSEDDIQKLAMDPGKAWIVLTEMLRKRHNDHIANCYFASASRTLVDLVELDAAYELHKKCYYQIDENNQDEDLEKRLKLQLLEHKFSIFCNISKNATLYGNKKIAIKTLNESFKLLNLLRKQDKKRWPNEDFRLYVEMSGNYLKNGKRRKAKRAMSKATERFRKSLLPTSFSPILQYQIFSFYAQALNSLDEHEQALPLIHEKKKYGYYTYKLYYLTS